MLHGLMVFVHNYFTISVVFKNRLVDPLIFIVYGTSIKRSRIRITPESMVSEAIV